MKKLTPILFTVCVLPLILLFVNASKPLKTKENPLIHLVFDGDIKVLPYDPSATKLEESSLWPRLKQNAGRAVNLFRYVIDEGSHYKTWISQTQAPPWGLSNQSLAMEMAPILNSVRKDKVFLHLVNNGLNISEVKNRKYVAFDFMADKTYQLSKRYMIHFQAWQYMGHPPLTMEILPSSNPNGPLVLVVNVRDDNDEKRYYGKTSSGPFVREIFRTTILRGEWNNFVFQLEPSYNGDGKNGQVALWLNNIHVLTYKGDWGFKPGATSAAGYPVPEGISLDMGIYRAPTETMQKVFFSNIKFGTTYNSVREDLR